MNRTRWLAGTAAVVAVVLGGGAALAAAGSSNPASDFLGDVAKRLGIDRDELEGAIEDATIDRIDEAVAAGDITKEQGEKLKERVRSGDAPAILPSFRAGPGIGPLGHHGLLLPGGPPGADLLGAAADYLGMDEADVREELHDGKSLAELAKDKGKSVDGLEQALRDAIRDDANQAVDDGALTKEQAERLVERLSRVVDDLVEKGGFPGPRLGPGPLGLPKPGILPGFLPGTDLMEKAADYLDMDGAELRRSLASGKSLADLAKEKGKSVDGLKRALRDAIRADADEAVDDGFMTEEEADRFVEKLGRTVDDLVEDGFKRGFGFGFRGKGGDFEFHMRVRPGGWGPAPEPGRVRFPGAIGSRA